MRARKRPGSLVAVLAAAAAIVLAACGGADGPAAPGEGEERSATARAHPALEHIHGLGVDPADGRLFIATHNGLFSAAEGQAIPTQVAGSAHDLMGFSVVGPGHFIASGHPAPDEDLPPHLGLIESRDAGATWRSVSLLGEADFHVLTSSGGRIHGFDGTQARLLVSRDGGRSWTPRTPPAGVLALAVDPSEAERVVASTEQGLFVSADGGRRWRPLRRDVAGLLAWPAEDALYLLDARGQVLRSADGGETWQPRGAIGGPPAALAAHGRVLYAASADGTVQRSADGGATWTVRTTGS